MMKSWIVPLLLLVFSSLSLAAAPYLAVGRKHTAQQREQNHDAIYNLSKLNREQLERNYEYFQKNLTDGERQKVRELHQALDQDKSGLKEVMKDYHYWLLSLNAQQRDELFNTPNATERIALMHTMVRKRPVESIARRLNFEFTWHGPPLAAAGLERVMTALEEQVIPLAPPDFRSRLGEAKTKLQRHLLVVDAIRNLPVPKEEGDLIFFPDTSRDARPLLMRKSSPPLVETVASRMGEFNVTPEISTYVLSEDKGRGMRLLQVLFPSLVAEQFALRAELQNTTHPTTEVLRQIFDEIPEQSQKDALLAWEAADFQSELRTLYLDKSRQIDLPGLNEIARLFTGGVMGGNRRRGGGGRGQFEQRGGRGDGGGGRGEGGGRGDGGGRGGRGGEFPPGDRGGIPFPGPMPGAPQPPAVNSPSPEGRGN